MDTRPGDQPCPVTIQPSHLHLRLPAGQVQVLREAVLFTPDA